MFAIWFLFGKEDGRYLEHIIKDLATQHNSPFFIPHITVYGLVNTDLETIDNLNQAYKIKIANRDYRN